MEKDILGDIVGKYCFNCESEAVWIIQSTQSPLCDDCHDIYICGQNNPNDSTILLEDMKIKS